MYYQYLFYIKKSVNYTDQEREFLGRLLFSSVYSDNFSLNRAIIELSFSTKLKRSFNSDKTKSQLLIYWASPIKITRIYTNFIQILESNEDKNDHDHLTKSEKYLIIGQSRIGKLSKVQAQYINRLIASTPFAASNIISGKSKSPKAKVCNHYKDFHSGDNYLPKV